MVWVFVAYLRLWQIPLITFASVRLLTVGISKDAINAMYVTLMRRAP